MLRKSKYLSQYRDQSLTSVQSIFNEIQFHAGLTSPSSKHFTMEDFRKFINSDYAVAVLCENDNVKTYIEKLVIHNDISKPDKDRCNQLLARTKSLSNVETLMVNLIKYQLIKTEEMFNKKMEAKNKEHQLELKKLQQQISTLQQSVTPDFSRSVKPSFFKIEKPDQEVKVRKRSLTV